MRPGPFASAAPRANVADRVARAGGSTTGPEGHGASFVDGDWTAVESSLPGADG